MIYPNLDRNTHRGSAERVLDALEVPLTLFGSRHERARHSQVSLLP